MLFGRVISVGIGYLCGMFLSGFLYGKKENVDLRKVGSGNVGTTNTMRNLGVKAGILTLIGDVCKVFMAMVIVWLIFRNRYPDSVKVLELYAGVGCILGHDFPAYMKFKGGKGIAVTSGLILMMDWRITILCLIAFALTVGLTRYVSLGSLVITALFMISWIFLGQTGRLALTPAHLPESYVLVFLIVAMAYWRHRANIKRLIAGTESKIGQKKE